MLCSEIARFFVFVVGRAGDSGFGTLGLVDNFRKVGRFWLFIQTVVDLPVDFIGVSTRIGHCVLRTTAFKLGFRFALHHVLHRDTLVRIILLRLRHAGIVSVQDTIVDCIR